MDRNVVIGTILIGLILFVWMYFLAPPPPPPEVVTEQDTVEVPEVVPPAEPETREELIQAAPAAPAADSTIAGAQEGEARTITIITDLYEVTFSTKGATPVSFELKEYHKFDQKTPVELVDPESGGAVGLVFTTPANHVVDTRSFYYDTDFEGDTLYVLDEPATLTFEARVGQGLIRQTYQFSPEEYEVGLVVDQENAAAFSTDQGYELVWNGGLPFTEAPGSYAEEAVSMGAYARSGGEVEGITLTDEAYEEMTLRGTVSWAAVKNKYFTAVLIPDETPRAAELIGERLEAVGTGVQENYVVSLVMPPAGPDADAFRLYLGPLEFYRITKYDLGLYGMVDYGWDAFEWITRPLAKYVFIPSFTLLSTFIPNYGIVIIIFAILIKLLVYPLTKSSYKSMARMRELQPKMEEIKEKYKDDPQKQQQAMMKMYKETGVNPLGGCLPMLLQYPIIIALWQFLQQSIEIRQEGFLWANDLSAPDVILNLPFTIPLYGDFVAGFTLLMGLSLVLQMRMQSTPMSGPQAKIMMYVMPAFLFVIFNRLPSGLSLYYLVYNVVTALQQKLINRSLEKEKEADGANGRGTRKDAAAAKRVKSSRRGGKKVRSK